MFFEGIREYAFGPSAATVEARKRAERALLKKKKADAERRKQLKAARDAAKLAAPGDR